MIAAEYGPLKDVVATAGAIMAAVGAIGLAWRGRTKWEPSEEDIPRGAQKVGALVAAVAIALMWAEWRTAGHISSLNKTAIVLGACTVAFLLVYGYLTGVQTYDVVETTGSKRRIIGGFWMESAAKEARKARNETVQEVLAGAAYDPDRIWSRPSRQLAKLAFQVAYLGLTISGTVALAAAAIRLGLATG